MLAALQRGMRHNLNKLLGCLLILTAVAACSTRRTTMNSQTGNDPLDDYTDNTATVVSCFQSAQPQLTIYQPAASAVVAGGTVTFRVSMPSCNNQLLLVRDGADNVTFAQNAYFEKVYAQAGTALETVRIQHKNPVSSGPSYVDVSLNVTIAASASTPVGAPSCQVAVQPGSPVPIPTDANLNPLAAASFLFTVTSPNPVVIRTIAVSPDPTKTQLRAPISTAALATQYVAMDISRPFYNIVTFQVAASSTATQMADCSAILYLNPVPMYPVPSVSVLIDGLPGPINAQSAAHVLTWSSTNATSCNITNNGAAINASGISGQLAITAVAATSTYRVTCAGPGGQAMAAIDLTLSCNPATNVLRNLTDRNTIARNLPRPICIAGTCGSYPPNVFTDNPNSADVVIKTAQIVGGLVAGQKIKLSNISGELLWKVRRYGGDVDGYSTCADMNPAIKNMAFQFTDAANNLIAVPAANTPSGTAYPVALGAMVPVREFIAGVVVPAGATRLWDSFPEDAYYDNEFAVSDGTRTPRSRPTTNGCHYTLQVFGCL